MARDYVCLYHSYLGAMETLGDAERGRLMTAMLEYSSQGAIGELRGNEKHIWPMIRCQIDRDTEAYRLKCEKNRESGGKRTVANASECQRTVANATKEKGKGEEKEEYSPPKSPSERGKRFAPPTVEEVQAYCSERNNSVDAQTFVDFYASKGWVVGKNPMKDWKAAVRTWERSRDGYSQPKVKVTVRDPFDDLPWA